MTELEFHDLPDGRRIAYRYRDGDGPMLVFLPGYMSDMAGGKATAVYDWAGAQGRACLLLDYSGCGASSGDFADGTLTRWRDEVLRVIDAAGAAAGKRVVLVGSSMGGWLMLMVSLALGERLAGMVGIAPAPDFSRWGFSDEHKAQLTAGETVFEDNPYGPDPTPTHARFWQDAETHLILDAPIAIDAPVRLLHGQCDTDVPWDISMRLSRALRSGDIQVTLVKDGDHRLSRDADIALLLSQIAGLPDRKDPSS